MICKAICIQLLLLVSGTVAVAQTVIGARVVEATVVLKVVNEGCEAAIDVVDPSLFAPGDRVLIHQVKGATLVDIVDDRGDFVSMGPSGNFEFGTVDRVEAYTVHLSTGLTRDYDVEHVVQLVQVIAGSQLEIIGPITCKPWDGYSGGVIVIESEDPVILKCAIDVTGRGFHGGKRSAAYNQCLTSPKMSVTFPSNLYGQKGEGIALIPIDRQSGRAKSCNGGGGGGNHNAGGGGGGNGGSGGMGGAVYNVCGIEVNGGLGGQVLTQTQKIPYLFMGGGGGGGHENESYGSDGGVGGGCIVVSCPRLICPATDAQLISAGTSAATTRHDGAGGGGAGGSIFLDVKEIVGNLNVNVAGGNGGDLNAQVLGPHGPGGGGGGGRVMTTMAHFPNNVDLRLDGGSCGVNKKYPTGIESNWYAEPGKGGVAIASCIVTKATSGTTRFFNNMNLRGTAHYEGQVLVLTDTVQYSAGAAWVKGKLDVTLGFDMRFSFRMSNGSDNAQPDGGAQGADGVVLVLQNSGIGPLGKPGQGLGYEDIPHGIAIEFDSYRNGAFADPSGSHVAVQVGDGSRLSPLHAEPYVRAIVHEGVPNFVADSTTYYARVKYEPGLLYVYIDTSNTLQEEVIRVAVNVADELKLASNKLTFVGLTSATGFATQRHEVLSWTLDGCGRIILGVNDDESTSAPFIIHPNPSHDVAVLRLGETVHNATIQVADARGAIVWTSTAMNAGDVALPVHALTSGMYTVRVTTATENWTQLWSILR